MEQNTEKLVKRPLVVPPQEGKETSNFDGWLKKKKNPEMPRTLRAESHYLVQRLA